MTDEPGGREPSRTPATRGRRFRAHEIDLADGSRLVLSQDGSIDHIDHHGSRVHRWKPDDPEWADQAIRFGLHPEAPTITPQGRDVQGTKPPRR
jgi:hypothetical protein